MTRHVVLGAWAAMAAGGVACEALSLATHRRAASIVTILELCSATPVRSVALFVGWMWLGWHLFAR